MDARKKKQTINSVIISLVSISMFLAAKNLFLTSETLSQIYGIRQILNLLPDFAVCVSIPFTVNIVLCIMKADINKVRLFYSMVFICAFVGVIVQTLMMKKDGSNFGIYRIIAYMCAAFTDMVLYEYTISQIPNNVDGTKK